MTPTRLTFGVERTKRFYLNLRNRFYNLISAIWSKTPLKQIFIYFILKNHVLAFFKQVIIFSTLLIWFKIYFFYSNTLLGKTWETFSLILLPWTKKIFSLRLWINWATWLNCTFIRSCKITFLIYKVSFC